MDKNDKQTSQRFSAYIRRSLQPIEAEKEACYLSKKCSVSFDDALNFLQARKCYCSRPCSDEEYLVCDELELIADYLDYYPQFTMPKLSSLLYHSNMYRCIDQSEKEKYCRLFPDTSSFIEAACQKGDE